MSLTGYNALPFDSENTVADQICATWPDKNPQARCQWVLEEITDFHSDESKRERACLREPRSVDAKAKYPKKQNPT